MHILIRLKKYLGPLLSQEGSLSRQLTHDYLMMLKKMAPRNGRCDNDPMEMWLQTPAEASIGRNLTPLSSGDLEAEICHKSLSLLFVSV